MSTRRPPPPPLGPGDEEDVFAKYRRLQNPPPPPAKPRPIEEPKPSPQSEVPAPPGTYASTPRRLLAYLLDAILLTLLLYVAAFLLGVIRGPVVRFEPTTSIGGASVSVDPIRALTAAVLSAVVSALYFVGSWVLRSATPGQRVVGIGVVGTADGDLSVGQAGVRWLLLMGPLNLGALATAWVPGLRVPVGIATLLWAALLLMTTMRSSSRQGLHDRIAGSVVTPSRLPGRPAGDE